MAVEWTPKTNDVDAINAEDFNLAFQSIQEEFDNLPSQPEIESEIVFSDGSKIISAGNALLHLSSTGNSKTLISNDRKRFADIDTNGNDIIETYATKEDVGNIETALDNIIAIQTNLIGGGSV